jgi:hypothetical protein
MINNTPSMHGWHCSLPCIEGVLFALYPESAPSPYQATGSVVSTGDVATSYLKSQ